MTWSLPRGNVGSLEVRGSCVERARVSEALDLLGAWHAEARTRVERELRCVASLSRLEGHAKFAATGRTELKLLYIDFDALSRVEYLAAALLYDASIDVVTRRLERNSRGASKARTVLRTVLAFLAWHAAQDGLSEEDWDARVQWLADTCREAERSRREVMQELWADLREVLRRTDGKS